MKTKIVPLRGAYPRDPSSGPAGSRRKYVVIELTRAGDSSVSQWLRDCAGVRDSVSNYLANQGAGLSVESIGVDIKLPGTILKG